MKKLMLLIGLVMASNAQADGFLCTTLDKDLDVKVYNYTKPELGTRTAAVMLLSDRTVQYGRKTIAKFTDINNTLSSKSAVYSANVDLRFIDSRRAGENIGGTKLGQLKQITVDVDFNYAKPVVEGSVLPGTITYLKRNGEEWSQDLICHRYLKGE